MPGRFVVRRAVSSVVGSAAAFFRKGSAGVLFFCAALSTNAAPTLRIAYLDSFSPDFYVSVYAPTVQYLKKTLPQYRFESVEMTPPVTDSELTSRHPDFLFASSGACGLFAKSQSLDLLSVRAASSDASPGPAAGSVFVVRADSDIHSVADLAHKKAAAAHAQAFSGWLTGLDRIAREGFDPKTFFASVLFTDYGYPDILSRVSVGDVDVGLVSLCELENAARRHSVDPEKLRIIGNLAKKSETCARSTELFPGAAVAAFPTAPAAAVKDVTRALLAMPVQTDWEWTSARNMKGIDEFLEHLHLGPYAYLEEWSFDALIKRFAGEILLVLALILAVIYHIVRTDKLVAQRTQELRETLEQRDRLAEKTRETQAVLSLFERRSIVSELSTMFAHEMKQPAANLVNYAAGLTMLARRRPADTVTKRETAALAAVSREAKRIADIVERVRAYAKHEPVKHESVNLADVVRETVENFRLARGTSVTITSDVDPTLTVTGDRVSLELLFLNLIRNADRALKATADPRIRITSDIRGGTLQVTVADNGPGVDEAKLRLLGRATGGAHPEGLGLGLTIAAGIAEVHGGHLEFSRNEDGGLSAAVCFPVTETLS